MAEGKDRQYRGLARGVDHRVKPGDDGKLLHTADFVMPGLDPGIGARRRCFRPAGTGRAQRGFTLFEMMIVLVIVGLALGLVLSRGSWRSPGLEARAVADRVAGALRLARSQAIAADHPVYLVYDVAAHAMAVDGGPVIALPPDVGVAMTTINSERLSARLSRIGFAPDGSSTGGRILFARGVDRFSVGVDWLTGRVSMANAR